MATNIAIFRINYKSDFILTLNSDAGWLTPFCIKFWTGAPSQAYFVGWDGTTYTHCAPVDGEPTKLLVQFDDHRLPIGDLKFQIGYHFTVADFPTSVEDEVLNQASVIIEVDGEPAQVMLDFNGETAPEIEFSLPAYANEAQRIANEEARIAAEQQRIANEESRIAAETIRQQNEQQRIDHETARVNEFATLKSQSQAATRDANDAAMLANQKAQLAADKAALADDAATLANQKAQLAADKAALANDAAQLADEKAALAQQKAEYAQTQGGYAKDQGDYAKAQGDYAKDQGDYAKGEIDGAKGDFESLDARFDHVDEISMYFEDEQTPADSDLIDEYEACLQRAYQAIADLLAVKDVTNESASAARQATAQALFAIDQTLNAKRDAEQAAALANDQAQYAKTQGDYAKQQADRLEIAGVFFEEAPLTE